VEDEEPLTPPPPLPHRGKGEDEDAAYTGSPLPSEGRGAGGVRFSGAGGVGYSSPLQERLKLGHVPRRGRDAPARVLDERA
jgi:hypothetical protein